MQWEMVVGLEVHAQLRTDTKIFCGCSTRFGAPPNSQVCPVCLGLPGALPVLNRKVVDYAISVGLATECSVAGVSRFARKNYFYPDLPKGYQISQFELPILEHGRIGVFDDEGNPKDIGITRIHMEEDAGKLIHPDASRASRGTADYSLVDLNRACVPLIEIVSEPDMRSAGEAVQYARKVRDILVYLGACDGNMNEGSMRVDANVSVRPVGQAELGTRTETKNINSFKFLEQAINYERERQIELIEEGGKVIQQTRLFNADLGITRAMRSKEEAHDYRYFPDPDLLPLVIDDAWVERARAALPELPEAKRARFAQQYALSVQDAELLCQTREMADFYENTVKLENDPKMVANWIMGFVLRDMNKEGIESITDAPITSEQIAGMVKLIGAGTISSKIAKEVFDEMWGTGKSAEDVVAEKGLKQVSDTGEIEAMVDKVLAENPKEVEAYRGGKTKLIGFFVGQVMRASRGKANPDVVNELLTAKLGG
jgi:aspartyl-tRNA(Asn)/glutamyl-tRNA(Gln) amidotransferase subunit B